MQGTADEPRLFYRYANSISSPRQCSATLVVVRHNPDFRWAVPDVNRRATLAKSSSNDEDIDGGFARRLVRGGDRLHRTKRDDIGESKLHLDWHTRFEICLGTARGLAYLHEESRPCIVHRDVKASNILLDANLNPKISDFGLAKLYDDKMSHISTRVAGTIGYIAPEYAMRGHLTEKADIFGFGVVALEIVSGRPNPCENMYPENMYLVEWAWHLHENNRALELVDPTLSNFDAEEAARMIGIGLLCIQASPSLRPPMSRVVAMLQGDIEVSTVTSKPGYLTDLPRMNYISSFMSEGSLTASTIVTSSSQKLSPGNESISP